MFMKKESRRKTMFNSGKKGDKVDANMIDTIIGESTIIQGTLTAKDTTRIDGTIKGEVKSEGTVIVGETGKVQGDIDAANILVAGTVIGNLRIREKMEVTYTGRILGDIFTKTLIVDEGASFKGNCTMDVNGISEEPAKTDLEPAKLPEAAKDKNRKNNNEKTEAAADKSA